MWNHWVFLCTFGFLLASGAFANILLIGNNVTLSFDAIAANFARPVSESGEHGTLFLASPLDACSPLVNTSLGGITNSPYVLIIRGGCKFQDKVRRAQAAGFEAAIVYNNDDTSLVAMAGDPGGIHIHAVFVSNASGLKLRKYIGMNEVEVWLIQNNENSAWSIIVLAFLSLLAMSAVLATCFFVRRRRIRRERPRGSHVHGMSLRLVKAMPSLVFTEALEDNCTSTTCAICLDDYNVGDKIRILPCDHKFHTICVDAWLTSWRTFCPVCKRDVGATLANPPASERTPLLSSISTPATSLLSSSDTSSSRSMQIGRSSSPSVTYVRSIPNHHESRASYSNSFACPSSSPLNSINLSFYSSPVNASSDRVISIS